MVFDKDNKKHCQRYNQRKQERVYAHKKGLPRENRKKKMGKENPKTRWKMQRGRD
jgi:hypothetical protein